MKKYFTAAFLVLYLLDASAHSFYKQLCDFNFNWKNYSMRAPSGDSRIFHSDKEYIQAHLTSVLEILRSNPVEQFSKTQLDSRTQLIALLDGYRIAGNFPINYYRNERIPVFIDENNTHCAVGFLMMKSGHEDLARRIAANDNYVWVKDINDPQALAWQESSGFTMDELKLIQGAYDIYMPNALFSVNRYETPQMPTCTTAYFTNEFTNQPKSAKPKNIWFKGEGANGVLNGRWEQNHSEGVPWIVGYYENGKRTGDWEEYYKGTKQLCRTEHWEENKLNGIRTRYDRDGHIIEEILFADGNAVSKVNFDLNDSVAYVRVPLDSTHMWTQVFNYNGELIACGHETVYNPGNLLWFQSIELTALNSAAISARSISQSQGAELNLNSNSGFAGVSLYAAPPLVEYKKEGDWMYYQDTATGYARVKTLNSGAQDLFQNSYHHYGNALYSNTFIFAGSKTKVAYDSIRVVYVNDQVQHFYGYSKTDFAHYYIGYFEKQVPHISDIGYWRVQRYGHNRYPEKQWYVVKEMGQYNTAGQKSGEWKYYDVHGQLYKTENYLIPRNEADEEEQAGL